MSRIATPTIAEIKRFTVPERVRRLSPWVTPSRRFDGDHERFDPRMALAYQALTTPSAHGWYYNGTTDSTTSVTIPSGTDLIVVGIGTVEVFTSSSVNVGGACTFLDRADTASDNAGCAQLWYRFAPTTGTSTVNITHPSSHRTEVAVWCFTGAGQTLAAAFGTVAKNNQQHSSSADALAVTSSAGDIAISMSAWWLDTSFTLSTDQTSVYNHTNGSAGNDPIVLADYSTGTSPTCTHTQSSGSRYRCHIGVAVKAAAATTAARALLLGVR